MLKQKENNVEFLQDISMHQGLELKLHNDLFFLKKKEFITYWINLINFQILNSKLKICHYTS